MTILYFDFETRSACNLIKAGAYRYSIHPTTQVMCFSWAFDDDRIQLWHREHPHEEQSPIPDDVVEYAAKGGTIEAHNSGFEYVIWNHVLCREHPRVFTPLRQEQMLCSAAKAAQLSLPRSLDGACHALNLRFQKDKEGHKVMLKVSKPRKPRRAETDDAEVMGVSLDPEVNPLWHEDPGDLMALWAYNMDDVRSERGLSKKLRDMTTRETAFWRMDQRLNLRGIQCDVEGVRTALKLAQDEADRLNTECSYITGGAVPKGSSRQKLVKWVQGQGYSHLKNTQADHLNELLDKAEEGGRDLLGDMGGMSPEVRRVLEICVDVNRTSTSKYKQMLAQVCDDGRLRDLMLYYGANRTGRWSGKGVQPHNFVRGFSAVKGADGEYIQVMEDAWTDIMSRDTDRIELIHGSVMECLAKATRGGLVASPGRDLMVADYAAIEARVLLWLADDQDGLDIFRRGEDIYLKMAEDIYERTGLTKADKDERQMGKKAVLGLGYQMGAEKFDDECALEGIDMPRAFYQKVVKAYREKRFPKVASLWDETNTAAVNAVNARGAQAFPCRLVKYRVIGDFLHCQLPSKRMLSYYKPEVREVKQLTWKAINKQGKAASIRIKFDPSETAWKAWERAQRVAAAAEKTITSNWDDPEDFSKKSVTFMGMDQKRKLWVRMSTYGGSLVENNTQATARDFLADAMLRCDEHPLYDMLLSVHDELIAECDEGVGDVKAFEELMSVLPDWAEGCPINAEGWRGKRYRK